MHPARPPVPDLEAGRAEAEAALSISVRSVSSRRASYAPEGGGGRRALPALARDSVRDVDPSTSQAARALALDPPVSGGDMAAEEGVAKVVDGSSGKTPPTTTPTTTTTTQGLLQRRRGGGGGRGCSQPCLTIPRRPNTWDFKTRESEWRARHSMWRYVQGTFFFIGPPDFLIKEIWPPVLFNSAIALLVGTDYVLTAISPTGSRWESGFLPDRMPFNLANMESLTRMMLLAVSLLATWRINRVYERWWSARQAFASLGTIAVSLAQRAHVWVVPGPATGLDEAAAADLRDAICRWSAVWHYSVYQMCTFEDVIHPDGAALMRPDEQALYAATRKPRQLVVLRLAALLARAGLGPSQALLMDELLQKGQTAAGVVGALRFQAMPDGLVLLATGFVQTFLIMLPLSWWSTSPPDLAEPSQTLPAVVSVLLSFALYLGLNLLFLGALAAADKLEDPFPRLPLADIVDTTRRDVARVAEQVEGMKKLAGSGSCKEA